MIELKRAYDPAEEGDGRRFLVDRLWPRGINKEKLALDAWLKEASPSNDLRRWFHNNPSQWSEFQRRYRAELEAQPRSWQPLLEAAREGTITLVYSSRNTENNNAVVLKAYLEEKLEQAS